MDWTDQVQFPEVQDSSFLHSFQTRSGVHPAFYAMGTRSSSPGVKRQGRDADHLPATSAEVKNGGTITRYPICLHGIVL
jgi:hypothetical protein